MKRTYPFILSLALISAVTIGNISSTNREIFVATKKANTLEKADWLLGKWRSKTAKSNLLEVWEKQNDSTLLGNGYVIKNQDTLLLESMRLEQRNKQIFYVPTVNSQNNNQPVRFQLKEMTNSQLVFTNPAHDFPQKITYTQINKDSLVAEISGVVQAKERSHKYFMKRIK